jgi:hypothetical protein
MRWTRVLLTAAVGLLLLGSTFASASTLLSDHSVGPPRGGSPRSTATVTFTTSPSSCGSITFNDWAYTDGQTVSVTPGQYLGVVATACGGDALLSLTGSAGVTYYPANSTASVGASGGLTANFVPSASLPTVTAYTSPTTCGSITFGGTTYTNGQSWSSAYGSAAVSATPCGGYLYSSITTTGGVTYWPGNSTASVGATGTITATFVPTGGVKPEVSFTTAPVTCGSITLAGVSHVSGTSVSVSYGQYAATATPCAGWVLGSLVGSGGVTYWAANYTASVGGNGGLTATFLTSGLQPTVTAYTVPSTCGSIAVAGTPWTNGQSWSSPYGSQSVSATPCTGYTLSSIVGGGGVTYWSANMTASVGGGGSLTATFTQSAGSGPTVTFTTNPTTCGSIQFSGTTYTNGQSVTTTYGSHAFGTTACPSRPQVSVTATGAVSFWSTNSTVSVGGSGGLVATFTANGVQPTISAVTVPSNCGTFTMGGSPWANGASWTTPYGTYTLTPNPCSGYKFSSFAVTGPLTYWSSNESVSVGGNGTITVTFVSTSSSSSPGSGNGFLGLSGDTGYLVLGALVAVVLAVVGVVASRRKKRPSSPSPEPSGTAPPGPPNGGPPPPTPPASG